MWAPQPGPQQTLIECPCDEIFFGGARGGGKTDACLGKAATKALKYKGKFNGVFFRQEVPMLDDAIERSKEIYNLMGASYNKQKSIWTFPGGSRLRFRPLESVDDAMKYQGQNITDIYVEEAGTFPSPEPIDRLRGALRSAHGVPTQIILTGNPGGPGQGWIKERYIDPAPQGYAVFKKQYLTERRYTWVFIPSKVADNKLLPKHYIDTLSMVGSAELVRAWLEGDWNAVEGSFFADVWLPDTIIDPFMIPSEWIRFRSMDWGSARPFSVGWYAISTGSLEQYEKGEIIKYREWYGAAKANVGLKLTVEQVAEGIKERDNFDHISYSVADPSIFIESGGPSIGETFARLGIMWRSADNRRKQGAQQMRSRISGRGGCPRLRFFKTCVDSIRTIPVLQHDRNHPEDVDTDGEDHSYDETRYAMMSRPYIVPSISNIKKIDNWGAWDFLDVLDEGYGRNRITSIQR